MVSRQFNEAYERAFQSATSQQFTSEPVQQEYTKYAKITADALLAHWDTQSRHELPVTHLSVDRGAEALRIVHPLTSEYTEDDAYTIAKVRFLGRKTIDAARDALMKNHDYQIGAFDFTASNWHDAHADAELTEELSYDSDAASPQRLEQWPRGEYVNCLGISIALAAHSELNNSDYRYMSNLRSARAVTAQKLESYFSKLHRINPIVQMDQLDNTIHYLAKELPDTFQTGEPLCLRGPEMIQDVYRFIFRIDTAFHHAVLQNDNGEWQQQDPYAMVEEAKVYPVNLQRVLQCDDRSRQDGACNELLLLDGDMQEFATQQQLTILNNAAELAKRIEKNCHNYKSSKTLRNAYELIMTDTPYSRDQMSMIWIMALEQCLETLPDDSWRARINEKVKTAESEGAILAAVEAELSRQLKQNTALREYSTEVISTIPLVVAMHHAETKFHDMLVLDECDKSMEVGDPAFQIGSMYMNHYARWDKSGIINVANELARINPSQLIWQSAVNNQSGPVVSQDVIALGAVVKSLKIGQQHPLVRITPYVKE